MDKYLMLQKLLEENKDKEISEKMSAYMRDLFPFYGIPSPKRKLLFKEIIKEEKKNKKIDWDFLDNCYKDKHREFHYFVIDYLLSMQKYINYDDIPKLFNYVKSNQWWDTIDALDKVIGDIGLIDERVDELMLNWSLDSDFWVRRLAINHQLGRKDKTNVKLFEKILLNNFGSTEFFINKAIGWSLREYSKTDPEWVRDFINKHKDKMDKLSIREGSKYI